MNRLSGRLLFWLSWPLNYVILRTSRRTRVAIICDGDVLVVKNWLGSGRWGLPGGGLHRREPALDGVRREVREEVGLWLPAESYQSLGSARYRSHGLPFDCQLFALRVRTKPVTRIARRLEISDIAWLPTSEVAPQTCEPDVRLALARLAHKS